MKTLLEHRYLFQVRSLKDDPSVNYAKRIVHCELLALRLGWDYRCDEEFIALNVNCEIESSMRKQNVLRT